VRIRKHEAVPQTGSYEVCFADGQPSVYFYWDDIPGRRLAPNLLTGAEALEQARALARAELAHIGRHDRPTTFVSSTIRCFTTASHNLALAQGVRHGEHQTGPPPDSSRATRG
jgi:hypothetical protein